MMNTGRETGGIKRRRGGKRNGEVKELEKIKKL